MVACDWYVFLFVFYSNLSQCETVINNQPLKTVEPPFPSEEV